MGTCPKCNQTVGYVSAKEVTIRVTGGKWRGVSYLCPNCQCILSVEMDPISLKADMVSEVTAAVVAALRKR